MAEFKPNPLEVGMRNAGREIFTGNDEEREDAIRRMDMYNKVSKPDLGSFYNDLKSELNSDPARMSGQSSTQLKDAYAWRCKARDNSEQLKDDCRKHLILDIYCKILPHDKDYIDGHMGLMKSDIDSMLASKGMTATQYLTSAYKETKAPLIEYVLNMTDLIGKNYLEEKEEELKDAQDNGIDIPAPEVPSTDDEKVGSALIDIKDDTQYKDFINALSTKTSNMIVDNIAELINKKKEENDMSFDTKPADPALAESTFAIGMDYLQYRLVKENIDIDPNMQDELMSIAIRESTMNILDRTFNQPGSDSGSFAKSIRFNRGVLVNESTVASLLESCKSSDEVRDVISGAKREFDNKVNRNLKASEVLDAEKVEKEKEDKK